MEVIDHFHALATSSWGQNRKYPRVGGSVDCRTNLVTLEKSKFPGFCQESNHDSLVTQSGAYSLYLLGYPCSL
jgi:hypothetical protein